MEKSEGTQFTYTLGREQNARTHSFFRKNSGDALISLSLGKELLGDKYEQHLSMKHSSLLPSQCHSVPIPIMAEVTRTQF